jgi:hypothetical protein
MVLHNLPLPMRNVFELFTNEQPKLAEIAQIRNNTFEEVQQLVKETKQVLQASFLNRYAID